MGGALLKWLERFQLSIMLRVFSCAPGGFTVRLVLSVDGAMARIRPRSEFAVEWLGAQYLPAAECSPSAPQVRLETVLGNSDMTKQLEAQSTVIAQLMVAVTARGARHRTFRSFSAPMLKSLDLHFRRHFLFSGRVFSFFAVSSSRGSGAGQT